MTCIRSRLVLKPLDERSMVVPPGVCTVCEPVIWPAANTRLPMTTMAPLGVIEPFTLVLAPLTIEELPALVTRVLPSWAVFRKLLFRWDSAEALALKFTPPGPSVKPLDCAVRSMAVCELLLV